MLTCLVSTMDFLSEAYRNLLISAYGAYEGELWRTAVVSVARFWWSVPLAGLFVGLAVGVRKRNEPAMGYRMTQTAVAVAAAVLGTWGAVQTSSGPGGMPVVAGVFAAAVMLPVVPGLELGMLIRRSRSARWYASVLLIVAFFSWLAAALSGGPAERMTKQELKQLFRDATGRGASADEKESFWGHTVGEETPTESRKSEFWRNR